MQVREQVTAVTLQKSPLLCVPALCLPVIVRARNCPTFYVDNLLLFLINLLPKTTALKNSVLFILNLYECILRPTFEVLNDIFIHDIYSNSLFIPLLCSIPLSDSITILYLCILQLMSMPVVRNIFDMCIYVN